jgi:hypothetical protein
VVTAARLREAAEKHAAAVIAGDVDSVLADLDPTLHDQIPQMVALMPEGLSDAELVSFTADTPSATTETRYRGATEGIVVRATWELRGDRYVITAAQPLP